MIRGNKDFVDRKLVFRQLDMALERTGHQLCCPLRTWWLRVSVKADSRLLVANLLLTGNHRSPLNTLTAVSLIQGTLCFGLKETRKLLSTSITANLQKGRAYLKGVGTPENILKRSRIG